MTLVGFQLDLFDCPTKNGARELRMTYVVLSLEAEKQPTNILVQCRGLEHGILRIATIYAF